MDADLYVPGDGWLHRADPRVKFLIHRGHVGVVPGMAQLGVHT